ncbi:methyl-accepting chemotaxis protein [Leptospira sp. 96542]|nr:methyl-accepting chemotaxis protein [Leptospira sp. 96542]
MFIKTLQSLSIKTRLAILPVPLLFSIFVLLFILIQTQNQNINFSKKEIDGIHATKPVFIALQEGLKRFKIGAEKTDTILPLFSATKDILKSNLLLDESSKEFQAWIHYQHLPEFDVLTTKQFINDTQTLALKLGDNSNLILDPDVDSYYQMDIVLFRIPEIWKNIANILEVLREEYSIKSKTNTILAKENKTKLTIAITNINSQCSEIGKSFQKTIDDSSLYSEKVSKTRKDFLLVCESYTNELTNQLIKPTLKPIVSETIFAVVESGIEFTKETQNQSFDYLEWITSDRINSYRNQRNYSLVFILVSILISISLIYLIIKSINQPLNQVFTKMNELSSGDADLTRTIPAFGKNEIGKIAESFNVFLANLNQIINQLKVSASDAEKSSFDLKKDAISVADNASELAATSEESAASLEELTTSFEIMFESISSETKNIYKIGTEMKNIESSISNIEKALSLLSDQSISSTELAQAGNESVKNTDKAMLEIRNVTKSITGIVDMITEISERTNLLALNASIEAARAGDAGMGFAVVAEEISKLADKTQNSVKNIKKLIDQSNSVVSSGTIHVNQTVSVLQEIVEQSNQIQSGVTHLKDEMELQSNSLLSVTEELKGLQDMAEMIEFSSREQKKASEDMVTSINTLSGSAQVLAQNSEDLNGVSQKISTIANVISNIANAFRTK